VALTEDELKTLIRLQAQLQAATAGWVDTGGRRHRGFRSLDAYYDGAQRLEQLGLAVPAELRQFVTIVNWPRIVVNAVEERIDLQGFRLPGNAEADAELWRIMQANDIDEESQLAHLDALVFGRGFVCGGTGSDPNTPLITIESPLEMIAQRDPRRAALSVAAKFYTDLSSGDAVARATLYLPNRTEWLVWDGRWITDPDINPDEHGLGVVPVEQLTYRARSADRSGSSHMLDAILPTDAAARALTNAQVATEVMALPQRFAAGMSQADFTDPETGEALTAWESYMGRIWATADPNAKFGQFTAADLSNFTGIVSHYAQHIAGMYGLPLRYMGQGTTNPPSADGIRAEDARLIKACERAHGPFGGSWERIARLVRRLVDGVWDPELVQLETLWRDPATPTRAQAADAAVKLYAAKVIPLRQTREDLGYSAVQIERMEGMDAAEASDPLELLADEFRRDRGAPQPTGPANNGAA
jgi:hypothetical protein